jgi:hypothetical protein
LLDLGFAQAVDCRARHDRVTRGVHEEWDGHAAQRVDLPAFEFPAGQGGNPGLVEKRKVLIITPSILV